MPWLQKNKLLIAVSGGLDSIVLSHLCMDLKMNIALAHCNFNLRGDESNGDEQFVLDLAEKFDIEAFVQNFDTEDYAKDNRLSIQMAARQLRYNWFNDLAEQLNYEYVLTAHHADDNLETFIINLTRGTGLEGLTGIPETNQKIIRPLLSFSRRDIEVYAKKQNLKWREDSSNTSDKYLRNAVRHHIIPKLKELNPQMLQNFGKTTLHLREAKEIVDDRIKTVSEKIITESKSGELKLEIDEIKKLSNPRAYLYQLLNSYGFTEWDDVEDLLEAQSGKQIISSTHRLLRHRNVLILSRVEKKAISIIEVKDGERQIKLEDNSSLFFDEADALFGKRTNVAYVDKDLLNFPLIVRHWQEGDYFYPFGMKGKKKLSKFFKDEKLSLLDKEKVLLLCSNNDIVWIINKRSDDRFKVTKKTKHILKITYSA